MNKEPEVPVENLRLFNLCASLSYKVIESYRYAPATIQNIDKELSDLMVANPNWLDGDYSEIHKLQLTLKGYYDSFYADGGGKLCALTGIPLMTRAAFMDEYEFNYERMLKSNGFGMLKFMHAGAMTLKSEPMKAINYGVLKVIPDTAGRCMLYYLNQKAMQEIRKDDTMRSLLWQKRQEMGWMIENGWANMVLFDEIDRIIF